MAEKIILAYPHGSADSNGTQSYVVNEVSKLFSLYGYSVSKIAIGDANSIRQFLREVDEPSVLLSLFYSDFRFNAQFNIFNLSLFDVFPCRNFMLIGDHLFSEFMWGRAQFLHRKATLITFETGALDEARLLSPGFGAGVVMRSYMTQLAGAMQPSAPPVARDIDLLVPMTLKRQPTGGALQPYLDRRADRPGLRALCEAVHDSLRHDRETQPLRILERCVESLFSTNLAALKTAQPPLFWETIRVLSDVDSVVRTARRLAVIEAVLRDRGDASVTFVSEPIPEFADLEHVTWLGPQPPQALNALYARARYALDVHPTYPDALSNRQMDIMANGALLLSDEPPSLRAAFERDRHYRRIDERLTLSEALEGCDVAQITADAAAVTRERYSLENWVKALIEVIDSSADA